MIKMRFEGGSQLAATLNSLPSRVSTSVMREALREISAPPIRNAAAAKVRKAPGAPDIADNIVISTGRGDATSAAIVVGPSTARRSDQASRSFAVQGKYLEFGTGRTPMFPFLRPAFESEAVRTLGALGSAMWAALISKGFGSTRTSPGGGGLA